MSEPGEDPGNAPDWALPPVVGTVGTDPVATEPRRARRRVLGAGIAFIAVLVLVVSGVDACDAAFTENLGAGPSTLRKQDAILTPPSGATLVLRAETPEVNGPSGWPDGQHPADITEQVTSTASPAEALGSYQANLADDPGSGWTWKVNDETSTQEQRYDLEGARADMRASILFDQNNGYATTQVSSVPSSGTVVRVFLTGQHCAGDALSC